MTKKSSLKPEHLCRAMSDFHPANTKDFRAAKMTMRDKTLLNTVHQSRKKTQPIIHGKCSLSPRKIIQNSIAQSPVSFLQILTKTPCTICAKTAFIHSNLSFTSNTISAYKSTTPSPKITRKPRRHTPPTHKNHHPQNPRTLI